MSDGVFDYQRQQLLDFVRILRVSVALRLRLRLSLNVFDLSEACCYYCFYLLSIPIASPMEQQAPSLLFAAAIRMRLNLDGDDDDMTWCFFLLSAVLLVYYDEEREKGNNKELTMWSKCESARHEWYEAIWTPQVLGQLRLPLPSSALMQFPQNLWPQWGLTSVSVQGSEQMGQLKSSSIIDLSDERMRKAVFFALIKLVCYQNLAWEEGSWIGLLVVLFKQSPSSST